MVLDDTILAAASPAGRGARAVLRLSGGRALAAVEAVAGARGCLSGSAGFSGRLLDLWVSGQPLRVWVTVFRAPHSYTGEDAVEVHLPSSPVLVDRLACALCAQDGVRWAGPGEFTLRAFLNSRMDLAQAEAVAQVIAATDEVEARAARRGLTGELGRRVRSLCAGVTELAALLEAALDFADEDLPEIGAPEVLRRLDEIREEVASLRRSSRLQVSSAGRLRVALAGFPNAGKSTLLNALSGTQTALVSPLAGTTRDPVRAVTRDDGGEVEWVDLAGTLALTDLESSERGSLTGLDIEMMQETRLAVRRLTRVEIEHADVVAWLVAADSDPSASFRQFSELDERRRLLIVSKADLLSDADRSRWRGRHHGALLVSALRAEGLDDLRREVQELGRARGSIRPELVAAPRYWVSAHQHSVLERCDEALSAAREAVAEERGLELAASDLRQALRALEQFTGRVTPDQILAHIFSRFCVGK
jgi:tRNA modification GTPase